jgi:hypothetical protein
MVGPLSKAKSFGQRLFFVEQKEKSLDGSNKGARDGRMT